MREVWLATGDGPATPDELPTVVLDMSAWLASVYPVEERDRWRALVRSIGLPPEVEEAVRELPTLGDAVASLEGVGEVRTLSGERALRPPLELREAIRLELRAWQVFLSTWLREAGHEAVRRSLTQDAVAVAERFSSPFRILHRDAWERIHAPPTPQAHKTRAPRRSARRRAE